MARKKPGPRPTPTETKKRRGNPGRRPLPKNEAKPPAADARPTGYVARKRSGLAKSARTIWAETAPGLVKCGLLTEADQLLFGQLCIHAAMLEQMEDALRTGRVSETVEGSQGQPRIVRRPELEQFRWLSDRVLALAQEFGMSPASRVGLTVIADGDEEPEGSNVRSFNAYANRRRK